MAGTTDNSFEVTSDDENIIFESKLYSNEEYVLHEEIALEDGEEVKISFALLNENMEPAERLFSKGKNVLFTTKDTIKAGKVKYKFTLTELFKDQEIDWSKVKHVLTAIDIDENGKIDPHESETYEVIFREITCELVNAQMLRTIFTTASDDKLQAVANSINYNITKCKVDSEYRLAHFFGQILAETAEDMVLEENLNYSYKSLIANYSVFKNNPELAHKYGRTSTQSANKEMIANIMYADKNRAPSYRLGNTQEGDGWRFRGRGLKQLTGRENYRRFTAQHKELWGEDVDFEANPDLLLDPVYATRSALYFWFNHQLYLKADGGVSKSVTDSITRVINRGTTKDNYAERHENVQNIYNSKTFANVCFNTEKSLTNSEAEQPI